MTVVLSQYLVFETIQDVRIGKFLEVDLQDRDKASAETTINNMCQKLLANMVIEDFRYEIIES